jgi:hypothetical protein
MGGGWHKVWGGTGEEGVGSTSMRMCCNMQVHVLCWPVHSDGMPVGGQLAPAGSGKTGLLQAEPVVDVMMGPGLGSPPQVTSSAQPSYGARLAEPWRWMEMGRPRRVSTHGQCCSPSRAPSLILFLNRTSTWWPLHSSNHTRQMSDKVW